MNQGKSSALRQVIANTSWLGVDKILRMVVGFFIYAWVARYLGAEQFGLWNFSIAFAGLFVVFSNLGLDDVVVRELVRNPGNRDSILGTAFFLKLVAGIITWVVTIIGIASFRGEETLTMFLVGLYSAGYIFQSLGVIDFYFKSEVKSKYVVYASSTAFIIASCIKLFLLYFDAPLIAFAIVALIEVALTSVFFVVAYRVNKLSVFEWQYNRDLAKQMLKDGFPLILFGVSIMLLMRVDQLMIGEMLGNREVGLYSAAIRIVEVITSLPGILIVSLFPAVIRSKAKGTFIYEERLQKFFSLMVVISLAMSAPIFIFSDQIVSLVYGEGFSESGGVLSLLIFASVFSTLALASKNVLIAEDLQQYIFYRTILALILNVLLNLWLIPIYGIEGAAFATVISQVFLAYISDIFFKKTRKLFFLKTKAFYAAGLYRGIKKL